MNQKEARKKDAHIPGGHIYELIEQNYVVDKNDGKDYVFISYSSKDWEKVLYESVYDTCKKYGLRVYFDTQFDTGSDSWLTQFRENMDSEHCKAVIAFISPDYKTSYATLMELMASQEKSDSPQTPVLPVILGNSEINDYDNTGLGTERFADGSTNDLWRRELKVFLDLFNSIVYASDNDAISNVDEAMNVLFKRSQEDWKTCKPYKEALNFQKLKENEKYWEMKGIAKEEEDAKIRCWENQISSTEKESSGEKYLNKRNNAKLISIILGNLDKNFIDGVNREIPEAIKSKLVHMHLESVFDEKMARNDSNQENNQNMETKDSNPENNQNMKAKDSNPESNQKTEDASDMIQGKESELFEVLRKVRTRLAKEEVKPPYMILTDKTLMQLCTQKPQSKEEMLMISGIGEQKYDAYGQYFMDAIRDYVHGRKAEIEKTEKEKAKIEKTEKEKAEKEKAEKEKTEKEKAEIEKVEKAENQDVAENKIHIMKKSSESNIRKEAFCTKEKKSKQNFYLTKEMEDVVVYYEQSTISEYVKQLNDLRDDTIMKVLKTTDITNRLVEEGYLKTVFEDGENRKKLTQKGKEIGIFAETRVNQAGKEYEILIYTKQAQIFLTKKLREWQK